MKGRSQSAIEFMSTYSWALLITAIFLATVTTIVYTKGSVYSTPSSCYISPSFPCYEMLILVGNTGSNVVVAFSNNLGTTINFPVNSFHVLPTYANTIYDGECFPSNAITGSIVTCNAIIPGFNPTLGSQLSPKFYVSYAICSPSCAAQSSFSQYNTTGFATAYASPVK